MIFKNFFTVVPKTGPSMTSFFTGRYMQNHGVVDNNYLRYPDAVSFVQALPPNYQTAAFVANPTLSVKRGYDIGFAKYQVTSPNNDMGTWGQKGISEQAINWINSANEKGNFFLWLHYIDPHGPYTPPTEYQDIFINDAHYDRSQKVKLEYPPVKGINENYILGAVPKYQRLGDHDSLDYYIAQYDAEIKYTDSEVGKVLNYLKEKNLLNNTIVIITADHGESLGENNYYFEHGMLVNEGTIHIPMVMSHPAIKDHLQFETLMQNIDIAPTLLNFLGSSASKDSDGIDFSDLILNKKITKDLHQFTYSNTPYGYTDFYEAIRTRNDKFIRMNDNSISYYDLQHDPTETTDKSHEIDHSILARQTAIFSQFGKKTKLTPEKEQPLSKDAAAKLRTLGYTH